MATSKKDPTKVKLGRTIAQARSDHGYTIQTIAALAGVNRKTWTTVEEGGRVYKETLVKIQDALVEHCGWRPGRLWRELDGQPEPEDTAEPNRDIQSGPAGWGRLSPKAQMLIEELIRELEQRGDKR